MSVTAKICGINDPEAMRAAISGGASHVGFVFYPLSPRAVNPGEAMGLASVVPERVQKVGLFVDPEDDQIDKTLFVVKLDFLQLHGQESPERVSEIAKKSGIPIIKAIGIRKKSDLKKIINYEEVVDYLLLDAKPESEQHLPGGNGIVFDWEILKDFNIKKPWFLAGGLNSENVSSAISIAGANMVDVSSGVEFEPGNKSIKKISSFVRSVNEYNK